MGVKGWAVALIAAVALSPAAGSAQPPPAAVVADPPVDAAHPAGMVYVRIPSHGALMNGVLYTAAGAGQHSTVLLLHGFPGNEQNLDLAQALRRAGYNVLTFHYRGSWGTPGGFSFSHAIEDADAAMAFLRDPTIATRYGVDQENIYVAGHSMGGFLAASATAHDPRVAGLIMISAWDIGPSGAYFRDPAARKRAADEEFNDDVIPLSGTSVDALMDEAQAHAADWDFVDEAAKIAPRPVLLITANDGSYDDSHRLAVALLKLGDGLYIETQMPTDHPYSDHRIALESAVVGWLQGGMMAPVTDGTAPR
jgi:pimeloyl-ACP methyl ester carboxylesterase